MFLIDHVSNVRADPSINPPSQNDRTTTTTSVTTFLLSILANQKKIKLFESKKMKQELKS